LKLAVGNNHPNPVAALLERGNAGDDATRSNPLLQGLLNGLPQAGKMGWIEGAKIRIGGRGLTEKFADDHRGGDRGASLDVSQDFKNEEVLKGEPETVPEIPHADVARIELPAILAHPRAGSGILRKKRREDIGHDRKQWTC